MLEQSISSERRGIRGLILATIVALTLGLVSWTAPPAMAVAPGITSTPRPLTKQRSAREASAVVMGAKIMLARPRSGSLTVAVPRPVPSSFAQS